jgi:very-short-patch-repair endonuclease
MSGSTRGPTAGAPARAARGPESVIAALAEKQHGVVARWQLMAAGMTAASIDWQVRRRRLHVLHRGVYRVGPLPQPRAQLTAAVLLCGATARLSHGSAAGVLGLLNARDSDGVAITALVNRRVPDWVQLHRVRRLPEDETTRHDHIPMTSPDRTLLDLAATAPAADVEHALIEALRRRLTDRDRILELVGRYPRKAGTRLLRHLLSLAGDSQLTRSKAERTLRDLVRLAELPVPEWNVRVEGYEVDAYWAQERVIVEVDGFALHSTHSAFQRDRRRDADLGAAGVTVMRVTWHQLTRRPVTVAARISAVLATARERRAGYGR